MQTKRIHDLEPPASLAFLIPLENSGTQVYEIKGMCYIGRDPENQIVIADPIVSRKHVKIERTVKGYLLRDLSSSNGTIINGNLVKEVYLREADKLKIGSREFIFTLKQPNPNPLVALSKSPEMQKVYETLPGIAITDLSVLVSGESGSGKEVIARLIHKYSRRNQGPFISINCSALGSSIIESELFGHKKGSFTDALMDRKGAFETARSGTLVLDEIGDLPLELQPKLLRALENKEIRAIGSDLAITTDVRIIASTHKSLKTMVDEGKFRADLYYRLNVIQMHVPPLRRRIEDIEGLIYEFSREMRVSFSHNAIAKMKRHMWPGNIRELKNVIARASALFVEKRVEESDIESLLEKVDTSTPLSLEEVPQLKDLELEFIKARLKANRGNQRKTALELGIPKSTFNDKVKRLKLNPDDFM